MQLANILRTIIIDDDQDARQRIAEHLENKAEFEVVAQAHNGKVALEVIQDLHPDLLFLDIELPDMSGFDVLEGIHIPKYPLVVFVTAYSDHAIKAFDFFAFDYLLKPYSDKRLDRTLLRVLEQRNRVKPMDLQRSFNSLLRYIKQGDTQPTGGDEAVSTYLPIKHQGKIKMVKKEDIIYVQASGYYIEIFTDDKKYLLRESMYGIMQKLGDPNFKRIHRSIIINLLYLEEIGKSGQNDYEVKMKNDQSFKIGHSYKDAFFKYLNV